MKILKATRKNIIVAAEIVNEGGLVVYPTETVYGLGCDPFNIESVKRLLNIKNNRSKPLPVLASSMVDVEKVAFVSSKGKRLASNFWPGSLTLVFSKKPDFPDIVTFGLNSIGLRIPNHNVALRLIRLSGGLLIGSSANKTGEAPSRRVQELSEDLKELVDVILDDGPSTKGIPSTIADLTSNIPRILRDGPISQREILDALAFSV
jgi:L-threonylcarbamoyladenylate synthase